MGDHWSHCFDIHGKSMANDCMVVCFSNRDRRRLCNSRVDPESGRRCGGTGETTVQGTRSMTQNSHSLSSRWIHDSTGVLINVVKQKPWFEDEAWMKSYCGRKLTRQRGCCTSPVTLYLLCSSSVVMRAIREIHSLAAPELDWYFQLNDFVPRHAYCILA